MKVQVETDNKNREPRVVIHCSEVTDDVLKIQSAISKALTGTSRLMLTKNEKDFFVSPDQILFFESVDGKTYAHTANSTFETKDKLYELENTLSLNFLRAGKSVILGTKNVLSIKRNLTGPSLVQFRGSHKQINVSRKYYKQLINKLSERSFK